MQTALEQKEKIFLFMQANGPSLPVQIASAVELTPLFASAFLSELYREKKVKISNLRVGSSPLYYIEGQEQQIENFVQHLNSREREAFNLIKENKILEDEKQTPVMRVALRAIGDFAIPLKTTVNDKEIIFWRYHLLSNDEAESIINKINAPKVVEKEPEIVTIKKKQVEITDTLLIASSARDYLDTRGLVLISVALDKKKEFHARVHSSSMFGPQHYYLAAKDKKRISASDVKSLIDAAQREKMPGILLCSGDPDKKAQALLNEWSNLIKFEKLNV